MYTKSDWIIRKPDSPNFWIDNDKYDPIYGQALKMAHMIHYMYDYELVLMMSIIRSLPDNAIVVNVGAGSGTSGLAIAEARPDLAETTWSIDMRGEDNPYGGLLNERNAFSEFLPNNRIPNQILGNSYDIGLSWNRGWIDFIFIDADHGFDGITHDIEAWKPKVKSGGFMMFHDYDHGFWPSVKTVVDEKMKDDVRVAVVDLSALFIKK